MIKINVSIACELSSLNFTSSFRAIYYPNVVPNSLFDNLDICLKYHASGYFSCKILFA